MKPILQKSFIVLALVASVLPALAQGTAFTFQGRLQSNGSPANGTYSLIFSLFNTNSGGSIGAGPVTNDAVVVSNGFFTTLVDFGPGIFTGASNWLEIAVSISGANNFTTLSPRQQLTPAPYAIYAGSANAANLVGTIPAFNLPGVALLAGGNTFNGSQIVTSGSLGVGISGPVAQFESRTPVDTRAAVFSGPGGGGWSTYKTTGLGNPFLWDFRGDTNGYAVSRSSIAVDLFMSYATGDLGLGTITPAVKLDVAGDIDSNGKSVPEAADKVIILRGIVRGDGTAFSGSGWTVTRTPGGSPTGDYTITFNSGFTDIPAVTVTPSSPANTTCIVSQLGTALIRVEQFYNGALNDGNYFSFIAIGGR